MQPGVQHDCMQGCDVFGQPDQATSSGISDSNYPNGVFSRTLCFSPTFASGKCPEVQA